MQCIVDEMENLLKYYRNEMVPIVLCCFSVLFFSFFIVLFLFSLSPSLSFPLSLSLSLSTVDIVTVSSISLTFSGYGIKRLLAAEKDPG